MNFNKSFANQSRRIFFAALIVFTLLLSPLMMSATTSWKLKSSEVLVGEEISRNESTIFIKTYYGKIELDIQQIESETRLDIEKDSEAKLAKAPNESLSKEKTSDVSSATLPKKIAYSSRTLTTTSMARNIASSRSLAKESKATTFDALLPNFQGNWETDYKNFLNEYLPDEFLLKFRLGYADTITNSNRSSLDMGLSIEKTWWDVNELFIYGFYNYAKEYYPSSDYTNVSMNRYGAGAEYSYSFLGKDSGFFTLVASDYKTDYVKFLDVMVDNMIGIGYDFTFLEDYGIDFDIAVGPGVRYSQYTATSSSDIVIAGHYTYFMAYARQNLTWRITKNLRIEQRLVFAFDIEHTEGFSSKYYEKSFYISAAIVYSPSSIFSIALRYSYDFDAENNLYKDLKNSYAEDTRLMIGVEIPLGSK